MLARGCALGGALGLAAPAAAGELCRFAGTTDYAGQLTVTTEVASGGPVTRVDVAVAFEAPRLWFHVHYLAEEVSTWRGGVLDSVAVNSRTLLGSRVVRQQWDAFRRGPAGLEAYRVQGKTLEEFARKHPGFVAHWDPAAFGQPWVEDYPRASPERRTDLDLAASPLPPGLRTPLALAFYWIRWLPAGEDVPVFLPGFKDERLLALPIRTAVWADGTAWQAALRAPRLSEARASSATAWIGPDRRLLQLAVDLHGRAGSARGVVHAEGCRDIP